VMLGCDPSHGIVIDLEARQWMRDNPNVDNNGLISECENVKWSFFKQKQCQILSNSTQQRCTRFRVVERGDRLDV
jgi:hypothetical protein